MRACDAALCCLRSALSCKQTTASTWRIGMQVNLVQPVLASMRRPCVAGHAPSAVAVCRCTPGWLAMTQSCRTESTGRSGGACRTMVSEPVTHSTHPSMPKRFKRSCSMLCASTALHPRHILFRESQQQCSADHQHMNTAAVSSCRALGWWHAHLTMMLSAPRGVTRIAGANAYAAKLAISPTTIVSSPPHHSGCSRYE